MIDFDGSIHYYCFSFETPSNKSGGLCFKADVTRLKSGKNLFSVN